MRGPEFLYPRVGNLKSRAGGFVPGSHATMRGLDLHSTFKTTEWFELYLFAISGRRFSIPERQLLQSIWTYTSYPDARLWNNRVAALAGASRSTGNLALAAALAVSEATVYGRGVDIRAITFLKETMSAVTRGISISECVRAELDIHRSIAGYGRPLTAKDERIVPVLERARQLGLDKGEHLKLALEIDNYLDKNRYRIRVNFGAIAAALLADLGFSPREYYLYGFLAFLAGMIPCYLEAADNPEGALFPIPCEDVQYAGPERRIWAERNFGREQGDPTVSAIDNENAPGECP